MNDFKFVSFWERLVAAIIDSCVLSVFYFLLLLAFVFIPVSTEEQLNVFTLIFVSVTWLSYPLYFAVMESSKWQGTIGKYAMKIKVVDKNGEKVSFGQAFLRACVMIFSTLILYIGWLAILWTKNKQTLHDIAASCYVVRK